ncbi:Demethylrebeccamycin-D-glucose O-methyltransferase [Novipirellula aureliae]|uniref:Demethylrebeccamycin-D-glucose O-methyltransferase n=1 Tax=Novipirellula aureliae TaxID=2527966 RepID=A0A5C6E4U1_9BACT|nr:class I SAM-dependent methyltransferase [Novipirellula aureliae]TWU43860.1 Demethylrebeccamycin-D-glucose O-methyltransferase [Novipirellula aureliae]
MVLSRTLEPESRSAIDEAVLYLEMKHEAVNQAFADDLVAGGPVGSRLIDLGCGPGLILIEIAKHDPDVQIMGVDSSTEMLDMAKQQIDFAGLLDRISLQQGDATTMKEFADEMADTVVSNSLIHHLADPITGLRSALRLVKPGGRVFIRDLFRPESETEVERLVSLYASEEPEAAQQLLRQSLHAALSLHEIRGLMEAVGMDATAARATSDRHWTIDWRAG